MQNKDPQRKFGRAKNVGFALSIVAIGYIIYCLNYPYAHFPPEKLPLIFGNFILYPIVVMYFGWYLNLSRQAAGKQPYEESGWVLLRTQAIAIGISFSFFALLGLVEAAADIYGNTKDGIILFQTVSFDSNGVWFIGSLAVAAACKIGKRDVRLHMSYYAVICMSYFVLGKICCHAMGCEGGVPINFVLFNRYSFPVQLCESLSYLVITILLILYMQKAKHMILELVYPLAALLYSISRFSWEFFMSQSQSTMFFYNLLSFRQLLMIACFLMSAVWLVIIYMRRRNKRQCAIN